MRPAGGILVVWTRHDDDTPWGDDVTALLQPLWERASHPGIVEGRGTEPLARHGGFAPLRRLEVPFEDTVDRGGTLAWLASFSVVGALPDAERADLMARFAGILDRQGVTTLHRSWRAEMWVTRRLDG